MKNQDQQEIDPPNGGPKKPVEDCAIPETKPPKLCPVKCVPRKCCKAPADTDPTKCLVEAISAQGRQISAAESAKASKAELEALLAKAKAAGAEYNPKKFEKLKKDWEEQDKRISDLLIKLKCAVPKYECVIECYVCPPLNALWKAEQELFGDGAHCCAHCADESSEACKEEKKTQEWQDCKAYKDYLSSDAYKTRPDYVSNRYDLRHWLERDLRKKERLLQEVKAVLTSWEKPAQTIEKTLADNATLIKESCGVLCLDGPRVVYDVFLKLLPLHLAIAPKEPATTIKDEFIVALNSFCHCDASSPVSCCGIKFGGLSFRDRLIGKPLPYLIEPAKYSELICCLAKNRYLPLKDAAANAKANLEAEDNEIKRLLSFVDNGLKSLEKDVKASLVIESCDCPPPQNTKKSSDKGNDGAEPQDLE